MTEITTYLSPGGLQETQGEGPATRMLIATLDGIVSLTRAVPGSPWVEAGRSLRGVHVGQLLHEPRSGRLFAGAHGGGGLWVSDDGEGTHWRPLTNGLDRPHIYALAVRTLGKHVTLFAGTSPAGLYRSEDLGESWTEMTAIFDVADTDKWTFPPPPHIPHVKQIAFHPAEAETLYVLVEQGAFLKSTDDGRTFEDLTAYAHPNDENYRDPHRLLICPRDPGTFYLATGVGVYRSADGGRTFDRLTRRGDRIGYPDFLFFDGSEGVLIMAGAELNPKAWYETRAARSTVMRSTDGGRTWADRNSGLPDPMTGAIEAMLRHAWDRGATLFIGTATGEVYASDDGGAGWALIADGLPPVSKDNHHLPFMSEAVRAEAMALRGFREA